MVLNTLNLVSLTWVFFFFVSMFSQQVLAVKTYISFGVDRVLSEISEIKRGQEDKKWAWNFLHRGSQDLCQIRSELMEHNLKAAFLGFPPKKN